MGLQNVGHEIAMLSLICILQLIGKNMPPPRFLQNSETSYIPLRNNTGFMIHIVVQFFAQLTLKTLFFPTYFDICMT